MAPQVVRYLQVRIVHLDSTDTPTDGPIIRVFGPTKCQRSACVYIKDFHPFFYIQPHDQEVSLEMLEQDLRNVLLGELRRAHTPPMQKYK